MGVNTEIHYKGRTMSLVEWADFLNIPRKTLEMRYRRGDIGWRLFRPVNGYASASGNSLVRELG